MSTKRGRNVMIYGPNKAGKSLAALLVCARGLVVTEGDAPDAARTLFGVDGWQQATANAVSDMTALVNKHAGKVPAVLCDDLSIVTQRTFRDGDWGRLDDEFLALDSAVMKANDQGTHVIFTCHEQPPRMSSGKYVRGGPALPGQLPERFTARSSIVFRVCYDETAEPWRYVFKTGPQPDYISGTRVAGIWPDPSPMNLAEGLRLAGYEIPRPTGLEWMEPVVGKLADAILKAGLDRWREVVEKAAGQLSAKYPIPHLRLLFQDALHRAILRKSSEGFDSLLAKPKGDVTVVSV